MESVNYLPRPGDNRIPRRSGFSTALDMLEENPLPAVAIVTPKVDMQSSETLSTLRDRVTALSGLMRCGWMTAGLPVWRH